MIRNLKSLNLQVYLYAIYSDSQVTVNPEKTQVSPENKLVHFLHNLSTKLVFRNITYSLLLVECLVKSVSQSSALDVRSRRVKLCGAKGIQVNLVAIMIYINIYSYSVQ